MVNIRKYISYLISGYFLRCKNGKSLLQIRLFTLFSITFNWSLRDRDVLNAGISIRIWRLEYYNNFIYWFTEDIEHIM